MSSISSRVLTGKVISDANGVITFPELHFTPNMIIVWRIKSVPNDYGVTGPLLVAVYDNGMWLSQCTTRSCDDSTEVALSNAEYDHVVPRSNIDVNGNVYSYTIPRRRAVGGGVYDNVGDGKYTEVEFNYAIYG